MGASIGWRGAAMTQVKAAKSLGVRHGRLTDSPWTRAAEE